MSLRLSIPLLLAVSMLAACAPAASPAPSAVTAANGLEAAGSQPPAVATVAARAGPVPGTAAPAAVPSAELSAFNVSAVPESTAALPPFPFFQPPEGLVSLLPEKDRSRGFDREHMIAGDAVIALEGKVFRDRFRLTGGPREYSQTEFHHNYRDAIQALGGVTASKVQYTHAVSGAFGGRAMVDRHYHGTCASPGCENHTYLIRQGDREYWLQVSTGGIPLHGQFTALERTAMTSSLKPISADEMKREIDAHGKVALQINFDTDRATLRPDAQPVLAQIVELLRNDPALLLSIEGHTDNVGDAARNRELSSRRADAVVAVLVAAGIEAPRLDGVGYGADRPVADNATPAGRAQNRRVELRRVDTAP